ncbi:FAD-dependent oxidoreductase [Nocardioides sp. R-C-SC26]|uniref:FAD-dependent oxidoreductase n=1 Tax=Nocardioides sp. R-C-SC26 TaxID=2870414 RepID=UPI001E3F20DE|nr:FAD-dependent oxidoreductase [Nocardioides sp. R-C-SC26]
MTTRVVIAGLGDAGLLTAIHLARDPGIEVVGISAKPGLVSGQELGMRLARPQRWARDYRLGFDRFRGLDRVRTVHASIDGVDLAARRLQLTLADGTSSTEPFDMLLIATGVRNGFWRRPDLQSTEEIDAEIDATHARLAEAGSIAVVGGGAAAVSSAAQLSEALPHVAVDLYFPGERALPHHHVRVWDAVRARLRRSGVGLHPGHRAVLPDAPDALHELGTGPITWSTGQPQTSADVVLWAIGRVAPNTDWLPDDLLDDDGFVRVDPDLRVPGAPEGVFAVGDVAATDPLRTSARNQGHALAAANIRAHLAGSPLATYSPPRRRWGSVLGVLDDGLVVFAPNGRGFRFPAWTIDAVLQRLIVRRGIYRGVRRR